MGDTREIKKTRASTAGSRGFFVEICKNFGRNWDLKLISVVLSVLFFMTIKERTDYSESHTVPVRVRIDEKGVVVLSVSPSEVRIVLKGTRDDFRNFENEDVHASVRVQGVRQSGSEEYITLRRRDIERPGGLSVDKIEPDIVVVKFDNEVTRKMPLALPEIIGKPLQSSASVSFANLTEASVTGSEININKFLSEGFRLPVAPIDVSGKSQSFDKRVEIMIPADSGIRSVDPAEVDVKVDIKTVLPAAAPDGTNTPPISVRGPDTGPST